MFGVISRYDRRRSEALEGDLKFCNFLVDVVRVKGFLLWAGGRVLVGFDPRELVMLFYVGIMANWACQRPWRPWRVCIVYSSEIM